MLPETVRMLGIIVWQHTLLTNAATSVLFSNLSMCIPPIVRHSLARRSHLCRLVLCSLVFAIALDFSDHTCPSYPSYTSVSKAKHDF